MPTILTTLTRWPPWLEAVLLTLSLSFGCVLPDYSFIFDHALTASVCVDTSKAVEIEAPVPLAIVLARNRPTSDELVDNSYSETESSATARDRTRASGRWLN